MDHIIIREFRRNSTRLLFIILGAMMVALLFLTFIILSDGSTGMLPWIGLGFLFFAAMGFIHMMLINKHIRSSWHDHLSLLNPQQLDQLAEQYEGGIWAGRAVLAGDYLVGTGWPILTLVQVRYIKNAFLQKNVSYVYFIPITTGWSLRVIDIQGRKHAISIKRKDVPQAKYILEEIAKQNPAVIIGDRGR